MTYNFKKVKVLVVECSQPMFELIKDVLGVFTVPEANISSAYTSAEAYENFQKINHDLLILDWLQSADNGIGLTHRVRTEKGSPNHFVPIIMTAGSSHEKKVVKARDAGVSEYLVKPFSAGSLAERITRVIEKPRQFVVSDAFTGPDRRTKTKGYTGAERRDAQKSG
jgi:DNA-binding response OmpR family regulator